MKDSFFQKANFFLFALLFFLLPLFFTPFTSELFEFNKIILLYSLTILIIGCWLGRMLLQKKIIFKRTFFDLPLLLFLFSQIIATIFSIDPHTSLFGYYSRFNGGLFSTLCYLLLYWAFVSNAQPKEVLRMINIFFASAFIVSVYGILEHFGRSFSCLMFTGSFDVSCWLQKVQERVFATFGQPNWLAAYLILFLPLTWHFYLNSKKRLLFILLSVLLFACLLFTQSRSGFLGLILSSGIFWLLTYFFFNHKKERSKLIKPFLTINLCFLALMLVFGTPFAKINNLFKAPTPSTTSQPVSEANLPSDDGGISQSSDIRKIVWKGAFKIFAHYPLFGSGVETFAYSYYTFRPIEHNLVSEWDFLYNKAHNEYLNYLATTGIFGLGTYVFFILSFGWFVFKQVKNKTFNNLQIALFSGWLSLLVTNFFGFSVVVTSFYFFLIPGLVLMINQPFKETPASKEKPNYLILAIIFLILSFSGLKSVINFWQADFAYNQGLKLGKQNQYQASLEKLYQAAKLFKKEPVYLAEIASSEANLALVLTQQDQASLAGEFTDLAQQHINQALMISPANLTLYKTKIKLLYTLSLFDPQFLDQTVETTLKAISLSPTDPKLVYNLGLLYGKQGDGNLAIETIQKAVEMKANYVDARNALAIFYQDIGENQKAIDQLQILLKLAPENKQSFEERLKQLQ